MAIVGSSLNGARHSILISCCACAPASIVEANGFGCNLILEEIKLRTCTGNACKSKCRGIE